MAITASTINVPTLPLVNPVGVPRVNPDGTPTKAALDWELLTRDWFSKSVDNLDTRATDLDNFTGDIDRRLISVTTTAGTTSAHLSDEITARANADSALAQRTSTVETTVGGHTSTLQVQQTSIDGIEVRYSVVGFVGGTFGGFVFSGVQQIGGGAVFGLEVFANMHVHGNVTIDGTLTTPKAAPNAWTDAGFASAGPATAITVFATWRAGAKILIRCIAYPAADYANILVISPPGFMRIHVNGTPLSVVGAGVVKDTQWNPGTSSNDTLWKLVPTPAELVYTVPFDGTYSIVCNFDTGNSAVWGVAWGEQAK